MHDHAATRSSSFRSTTRSQTATAHGAGLLGVLSWALARHRIGRLNLSLPSGISGIIGDGAGSGDAQLTLRNYATLWKLARRGALGFAESYMDGDFDTDDLKGVLAFYVANQAAITTAFPSLNDTRKNDRRFHYRRTNTPSGSRRNIAEHYDLGNAFYQLWLDPSQLYSSAIYSEGVETLEAAQQEKLRRIMQALGLSRGHRLLEIGCGWGALAHAAGHKGADVRAITISQQQLEASQHRIAAAGLSGNVGIHFEDYRDTVGTFDRIVSIEMIEAVGEDNWPLFFKTVFDRLEPGGWAVIQAITIREDAFAQYRQNPDFIQRYIFPGGMLPTISSMQECSSQQGLVFETVERFGSSYALTLEQWRSRFEAAWPQIAALGFDERFRRMWRYYLTYSEVGFESGLIDVGLYKLSKPA